MSLNDELLADLDLLGDDSQEEDAGESKRRRLNDSNADAENDSGDMRDEEKVQVQDEEAQDDAEISLPAEPEKYVDTEEAKQRLKAASDVHSIAKIYNSAQLKKVLQVGICKVRFAVDWFTLCAYSSCVKRK